MDWSGRRSNDGSPGPASSHFLAIRHTARGSHTFPAPIFNRFGGLFAKTGPVVLMVLIARIRVSSAIRTPVSAIVRLFWQH